MSPQLERRLPIDPRAPASPATWPSTAWSSTEAPENIVNQTSSPRSAAEPPRGLDFSDEKMPIGRDVALPRHAATPGLPQLSPTAGQQLAASGEGAPWCAKESSRGRVCWATCTAPRESSRQRAQSPVATNQPDGQLAHGANVVEASNHTPASSCRSPVPAMQSKTALTRCLPTEALTSMQIRL